MHLLVFTSLLAMIMATTSMPPAKDAPALTALLNEFLVGATHNDPTVHERFWADDLIYTSSSGRRMGKPDILRDVRSTPAQPPNAPRTVYTAEEIRIQQYGDAALIAFRLVAATTAAESTHVDRYLNSGMFLKRRGIWQAVGWQATRIP
jgi:hypothetical protein